MPTKEFWDSVGEAILAFGLLSGMGFFFYLISR